MEKAKKDNDIAYGINDKSGRYYFNLGLMEQKEGNGKKACDAWRKSLELDFFEAKNQLDLFCDN